MKKRTLFAILAAVVLLAGGAFAAYVLFSNNEKEANESATTLDDTVVLYVDLGELYQKSAITEILPEDFRSIAATIMTCENTEWKEYTEDLLADLGTTGIDIDTPLYGYVNVSEILDVDMVYVAKVENVSKLDRFVEYLGVMSGEYFDVVREGDTRMFEIENVHFAYNKKRLVAAITSSFDYDATKLVDEALSRPTADLSAYAKYDIAASANLYDIMDILCARQQASIDASYADLEYCTEDWEYMIELMYIQDMQEQLAKFEDIKKQLDESSRATLGIAFEDGRVVVNLSAEGMNNEYTLDRKVSNDNLAYLSDGVLAVLNLGVNGEMVSEVLSDNITPDYADMLGISRNEFNIYFGVLSDALKSIDGDVTLGINDLNGDMYGGPNWADALLAINVNDDYIISNVSQFGASFLETYSNNTYGLTYAGNNFKIGQQDETLYVTANSDFAVQANPATTRAWVADVDNSYGYFVIDIDNMMSNDYVKLLYRHELNNMDSNIAGHIDTFAKAFSYVYLNIDTPTSVELVLVFDDKQTNSLEQIVRMTVPIVIGEVTSNM